MSAIIISTWTWLIPGLALVVICQGQVSCEKNEKVDAVYNLYVPPLEQIRQVLTSHLLTQFSQATVEIVKCPDLTKSPLLLAASGFGGNPKLVDVGGAPYLLPLPRKDKIYNLSEVVQECGSPGAFAIGPGAGPFFDLGHNCEMMANVDFSTTAHPKIATHLAWIANDTYVCEQWSTSTGFAILASFLLTDGKPGTSVIKVVAKRRTTKDDFITSIRNGLSAEYGNRSIGIGGVFVINSGKVKMHVMPELSNVPLNTSEEVDNWLRYFDMDTPLTCLTVFYSHDPGLDLRIDHSHCFGQSGQGGHYHYDITPDEVEYEAYFTLAEKLYRVDRPPSKQQHKQDSPAAAQVMSNSAAGGIVNRWMLLPVFILLHLLVHAILIRITE